MSMTNRDDCTNPRCESWGCLNPAHPENQFKREPRYIVFKIKDLRRYCSEQTQEAALSIGDIIANGRRRDGKAPFNAVVVEQDWPEFEPTWAAIEARMKEGR